ncbi:MAG: flagellar motor switch protein FliG [Rhodobacteraceae bacterium]|nr:flagellar motor switch protein FliG [Paracoccaceae bacterium]
MRPRRALTRRQKAAIIVRLLLKEGAQFSLDELPETMQVELTHEMGALRSIDRETLQSVVREFVAEVKDVGAAFPGGLEGALAMLNGALSPDSLRRLRLQTGVVVHGDPWGMIEGLDPAALADIIGRESVETAAVILSKLPVQKSAAVLGRLPGDMARRITYAVSTTGAVDPETVRTIGHAIATQLATAEMKAFEEEPVSRVGAMLNLSDAETRDGVLDGLTEQDEGFATAVRKAIFTFANIPERIDARDIPKIARAVDQGVLVTALVAAEASEADAPGAAYILENMSKRLAAQLREDMQDRGKVKAREGEEALNTVVAAIRDMEQAGELTLLTGED